MHLSVFLEIIQAYLVRSSSGFRMPETSYESARKPRALEGEFSFHTQIQGYSISRSYIYD